MKYTVIIADEIYGSYHRVLILNAEGQEVNSMVIDLTTMTGATDIGRTIVRDVLLQKEAA